MALQTEVWIEDIQEVLFSGPNEFLRFAVDHDGFVSNKTVHVPQAGSIPGAEKNRSVFPATISERTDTDFTYNLDNYTTDPIRVGNLDELQVSYAKRQSVMRHHLNVLMERMAQEGIFDWASDLAANQVRTSGSTSTTNLPPGATGSRKKLTIVDLANLAKVMDEQNIPDDGNRYILIPPALYFELFTEPSLITSEVMGTTTLPDAVLKKILNFNFIKRSSTLVYDNTPIRKAVGAATASTDNFGAIAWHSMSVATAMGEIDMFEDVQSATNYGDIISAEVNHKTTKLRSDEAGIVTIIQEP